ncbi:SRPBCC domain-containing protein [Alkalicoccus halolimnae]|uniref:SRPBCC domain-containing protein n=1 Tax=Alkalicoccus halolimnae TaxID=1667239 RepID=A0A5C7FJ95_9BACI|nr:SRPBCC domain-containing protein [Alkalicoccus halolimnae]TXF86199.1 hypothetical protein FTX54_06200 [Alkalicoccus halolimnae]
MTKLPFKDEVFEAIVDPVKIGNYWFSSSLERWGEGRAVTLRYEEYDAEGVIYVLEVEERKKIVFSWGSEHGDETVVTIRFNELDDRSTIIEVTETGLKEEDPDLVSKMMGQKEGRGYTLKCLKAYLESGITSLRASLIH